MSSICIIPARGGSKRIPGKNIKPFLGKPIIAYSIEAAISSRVFDEVMVSTDSSEISEIAKDFGASVPFLRDPKTADDHTGLAEVLIEVLKSYEELGRKFDELCCLLPTAVLMKPEILSEASVYLGKGFDGVFPVVRFSYPIWRSLKRSENGAVEMFWPENYSARSQDLQPAFHDAGQFYFVKISAFLREKKLFLKNSASIELPETAVQDIDTPEDWEMAELKFKR